ncbi:Outer membrane receptor proteins, mostly Fe transport [Pontibacter indicus]|uniref:Outer membrane receptor proteins, mostly Fe transport n=2 Tax=Pontibacter indicus TaxID=1317125 RepID=A0A1R3XPZ8_9BACT|nr:Outer membrane receptor proteins, mostly Fe transport [Pontibacter indicus]
MKSWLLLLLGLSLAGSLQAQYVISGKVLEKAGKGAPFATVTLLQAADSSLVKGALTDEVGQFQLRQLQPGSYLLAVSSIGFKKYYGEAFSYEGQAVALADVVLQPSTNSLGEVTITAQRQVMERKADRYVMHVAASSFQSDNLQDILQALPFVQIKGEEIAVNGKGGVLILLDNVQMPGATLSTVLGSMTGDEVEQIEFITNPSSRYPASVGSVIKITTKRSKQYGMTGSARLTASQGHRGKLLGGTSMTYRREKWVGALHLNYNAGTNWSENNGYRVLQANGERVVLHQDLVSTFTTHKPSLRGSFEYTLGKKSAIGLQATTSYNRTLPSSRTQNRIRFTPEVNGATDSLLATDFKDFGYSVLQNYSLFYRQQLDTLGKSMDVVLTYTPAQRRDQTEMDFQHILSPQGELRRRLRTIRNINASQAAIWVGQVDWELPFRQQWNVTTGAKLTHSRNSTQPTQEVLTSQGFIQDGAFSFENEFEENIVAAYASVDKAVNPRTRVSAGLRSEYATMRVDNITSGNRVVDRDFLDFFPTLLVNHTFSEALQVSANYRATIQRPGFQVLTPFRVYVDDFTITEGNPALRPKYTSSYSLNAVYKGNLFVEFEYKDEQDVYTQLPAAVGDVTVWKDRNFDLSSYSLVGNYGYKITNWWSGSVFAYGAVYDSRIDAEQDNAVTVPRSLFHTFGIENTFSLPAGLRLETSFKYTGPFRYGLIDIVPNHYSRIALKGDLLDKKLQYTLAVTDLLRGDVTGGAINAFNVETNLTNYYDARRVQVGLVYKFGKSTVKNAQNKKLGNEDVVDRVQ